MSPFDELMAQHAQQLQRERTLLRMNKTNNVSAGQQAGGQLHNSEVPRSKSAGGNHADDKIPPIPPPPISTKIDDIVPHLADPPFEYSTPAMSDLPKKSLSENTAEIKKGLLSSILEKVKSKEEAESQISRNNKRLLTAPLASSESLSVSDTSTKRMSATSSNLESTTSSMPNPTVVLKFRNVCALFGKIWHFKIQKPFLKYFSKLNKLFLASEPLHFAFL